MRYTKLYRSAMAWLGREATRCSALWKIRLDLMWTASPRLTMALFCCGSTYSQLSEPRGYICKPGVLLNNIVIEPMSVWAVCRIENICLSSGSAGAYLSIRMISSVESDGEWKDVSVLSVGRLSAAPRAWNIVSALLRQTRLNWRKLSQWLSIYRGRGNGSLVRWRILLGRA